MASGVHPLVGNELSLLSKTIGTFFFIAPNSHQRLFSEATYCHAHIKQVVHWNHRDDAMRIS
jgi:hypothetical protein